MKVKAGGGWLGMVCVLAAVPGFLWAAPPQGAAPRLDRRTFEARGRHEALLAVPRFGRVSVLAKSPSGTGIQLVDRMAGPGVADGQAGERDGRLDLLLDAGSYKIVATSPEKGQGELTLSAKGFAELNPRAPVLLESAPAEGRLEDFQQASYWLEIGRRQTVYLEAVGRDLADLRLWLEGNWLLDAEPEIGETSPVAGQPQTRCLLIVDLSPGTYLLTAYGGPARPWPKETGEHPFHLRSGLPVLDSNVRLQASVSPFGRDRYLVPQEADTFILQLAEQRDFRLELKRFRSGAPLDPPESVASITKKSQDPECLLRFRPFQDSTLVTVVGPPGEPYDLQVFQQRETLTIRGPGRYWLSSLHSGRPDDSIDATGILVSDEAPAPHAGAVAADVLRLGPDRGWARRFNLLESETLFFYVEEAGTYETRSEGTECLFLFEPFMLDTPPQYRPPEPRPAGASWDLDPGYWVLRISPVRKGVASVAVREKGGLWQAVTGALGGADKLVPGPAKGACRFPELVLSSDHDYTLHLNHQEGVQAGLVLRTLPLDLARPLPVTLSPGEELSLPFQASRAGRLQMSGGTGTLAVDGAGAAACAGGCDLAPGAHTLRLRSGESRTATFTLRLTPAEELPTAPPRFLPAEVEARFGKFPVVTPGSPLFLDLAAGERATALLEVPEPGLYRVETTGLLATRCALRARTQTRLFEDAGGGAGRNSLIQAFLRAGEYQVSVSTVGSSAGHLGVRIRRTELSRGEALTLGGEVRESVPAGAAVLHPFVLPHEGRYTLSTTGVRRTFRCRLEDRDGWPLEPPGAPADLTRPFAPGEYRYISLAEDVDTLRRTRLSEVVPAPVAEGRGPHALTLNTTLDNVWREGIPGADRGRDLYDFEVPAEVDVRIALGESQMQAYLSRREGEALTRIAALPPGKPWDGALAPGAYRLEVECSRLNDLLPYAVTLTAAQLAPGLTTRVKVPAQIPVRLSRAGSVEIASSGDTDVRARLYRDSDGSLVGEDDDDTDSWDFRIARVLEPGRYTLRVEPVGGGSGSLAVAMRTPVEVGRPALALPADETVALEGKVNLLPLPPAPPGSLLVVRATGPAPLGLILESLRGDAVRPLAQRAGRECEVILPVAPDGRYRLRLWSRDPQGETARLQAALLTPPLLTEAALRGSAPRPVAAAGIPLVAVRVQLPTPGTFRFPSAATLSVSRAEEEALEPPPLDTVPLPAGLSTLAWKGEGGEGGRPRAERVALGPGDPGGLRLALPGGTSAWVDLKPAGKGVTLATATAETGLVGCALAGPGPAAGDPLPAGAFDFFGGGCVSATASGGPLSVRVWNGAPGGPALPPALLRTEFFPAPEREEPLPAGTSTGELPPGGALFYSLPGEARHLVLDLEGGLVALLPGPGPSTVLAPRGEALHQTLETAASRLVLLNPSGARALFSLTCVEGLPAGADELRPGPGFERICESPGTIRLRLPETARGAEPLLLCTGPGATATVMDADGTVQEGVRIALKPGGGLAWLSHEGGAVRAWLATGGDELAARWGASLPAPEASAPLASHALEGAALGYGIDLPGPGVLRLESDGPCVLGLMREGSSPSWLLVQEGLGRLALDRYVDAGRYRVCVRTFAGRPLAGTLRFSFAAVLPIAGATGPETLAGGGESRTFSFTLRQAGPVGIGIRAGGEHLACELLDPAGRLLGSGIQQFARLEPGTYLLRVRVDEGSPPVRFQPVVLGLEPPGSGPPEEALAEFLAALGVSGKGE